MTFKEMYKRERAKDKDYPVPSRNFIRKIARITKKSEGTVRMWLYHDQTPDELSKSVLAGHFQVSPQELFPPK